jgi:SprT-like family
MKRSKDYYLNRKKLKDLDYSTEKYKPTPEKCWEWFNILNEQIFGGLLEPVKKIFISNHKKYGDVYALYYYNNRKRGKPSKISLCKKFENEKMFVEILAHEMIHHFQYTYGEPVGHGPSFMAWRENFILKGLKLYKAA